MWLWGPRSGPSLCGGPWPSGAIIFLGGAAMELACIRAILERTASQPSSPACREKEWRATLYQLYHIHFFLKQFEMIWISVNLASDMASSHQRQHPEWHKTSSKVICNHHFGVLKTNPFHMVADWAAGQMWHCCGVCERRDRGGDKVIQRSVSQDGRAGGKPHPPHSSSIKTEEGGGCGWNRQTLNYSITHCLCRYIFH